MKKLAILLACTFVSCAYAQKACTPGEAQKAQKAVDMVMTWQQLHKAWKDWGHCDAGEVGETYTDALLRLMVDWKNVDAFAEGYKDESYRAFVKTHLQSPAAKDDIGAIRSRAKQSCPKGQDELCKQIVEATEVSKPMDFAPMAPIAPAGSPK